MTEDEIIYKIRGSIFTVYNKLGPGLLEAIYQEALTYQLRKDGLRVDEQFEVPVFFDGLELQNAKLKIDILVEKSIVVELKSVEELKKVHYKQLQTYLRLSHLHVGLLVNFNTDNIVNDIHRVFNGYSSTYVDP